MIKEDHGVTGIIQPGVYSVIKVEDTGPGIDESILPRIFEPFFSTKEPEKGTGLGLSVVYGVVKSHSGNIQIESRTGGGTVFRLYFPAVPDEAVSEKIIIEKLSRGNEKILFVDDEEMLAELGKSMLNSLGYSVKALSDSREALNLLKASMHEYDLLITDQTMPVMTGLELAEEVVKINPDFPVIICTGFSSRVDRKKAEEAGCRGFMEKPLTLKKLSEKIREVLDS